MKKYRHIFFDLDHTLWDCDRNSAEALKELIEEYQLDQLGIELPPLVEAFDWANHQLWLQLDAGEISKQVVIEGRFPLVFERLEIDRSHMNPELGAAYEAKSPRKPHLVPHAQELLDHLRSRDYRLHLITNGGPEQFIKLEHAQIGHYFEGVFTSHSTQSRKPQPAIFNQALLETQALIEESLMIGDSVRADVNGAQGIGLDVILFNAKRKAHQAQPTHEVHCLSEIFGILA